MATYNLSYRGRPVVPVLEAKDFDNLDDLNKLDDKFGPQVYMTLEAWKKYDDLLIKKEELMNGTGQ